MASVWHQALRTVRPEPGGRHGPLPPLLLALTVVTGLVDAVSYLGLGHVFVANMTGNVVITGFALAGAQGFSTSASLTALGAFCLGAAVAVLATVAVSTGLLSRTAPPWSVRG